MGAYVIVGVITLGTFTIFIWTFRVMNRKKPEKQHEQTAMFI